MQPRYKPVGGVESVALYPADAVQTILFSSSGCEVVFDGTPVEVELLDDHSVFEERLETSKGATKVLHKLTLVADRGVAEAWLADEFIDEGSYNGLVAVVKLCDGRQLLCGYSHALSAEQPLFIESITTHSGSSLHDTPSVALHLVSQDTEFSQEII